MTRTWVAENGEIFPNNEIPSGAPGSGYDTLGVGVAVGVDVAVAVGVGVGVEPPVLQTTTTGVDAGKPAG